MFNTSEKKKKPSIQELFIEHTSIRSIEDNLQFAREDVFFLDQLLARIAHVVVR